MSIPSLLSPRAAVAALVLPVTALGAALAGAAPASAVSTSVVIAEVYGGGGNTGATLRNDFIELYNASDTAVPLTGWSVQYYSAGGSTAANTLALGGSIAPRHGYLIQMAAGAGGTTSLPTPDATGTAAIGGTAGRIDLRQGTTVVDRVGYGTTATTFEGASAAPAPSNTTSVSRFAPCADTDQNGADFVAGAPTPESSAVAVPTCAQTVVEPQVATIPEIQGESHLSALAGDRVSEVAGLVVAVGRRGFWMQNPTPDDNLATSEGIYVFTSTVPTTSLGDAVLVDGTVEEFRPGGGGGGDNTTITELVAPTVAVQSSGNALPAPVVIGVDRIAPQQTVELGNPLSVEYAQALFRPETDAIDFYESLEGMLVGVRDAQVVGPTASFGEIPVVPGQNVSAVRSELGGVVYGSYGQPNAMRLQLDDTLLPAGSMPGANVGDSIPGLVTGVVDYSFANYKVFLTAVPTLQAGPAARETAPVQKGSDLSIATYNVENLAPGDPADKFARLAAQLVDNLRSPDIVALEEIQDNSGAANDGTVASDLTVRRLTEAITAAGGPAYASRWIDPQDGTDGGQPGGNIRQVFIYRPDRDVEFVDTPGGTATAATTVVTDAKGRPHLSASPGRITPASEAWTASRKPLAAEFRFRGETVFAIANHFSSKGGDDPLFGRWQQPVRSSEVQRHAQAAEVRTFVDAILAKDVNAHVVVLGDINDFEFSQTTQILVGSGAWAMTDLPRTLPASQRWTYVYEGNSQVLDHILVSRSLATVADPKDRAFTYDIVHTNAAFFDQDSDHDPQVVQLNLKK